MYCNKCGNEIPDNQTVCPECGADLRPAPEAHQYSAPQQPNVQPNAQYNYQPNAPQQPAPNNEQKSKLVAGLLGIFLGSLGIHNFYLGYTRNAIIQLCLTIGGIILSCIFIGIFMIIGAEIWGLIEGIMILAGKINVDGKGIPLAD